MGRGKLRPNTPPTRRASTVRFNAPQLPAGTAEARISYGNCVCLSDVSRSGGVPSPGEIETPDLHHMIAKSLVSNEVIWCHWVKRFPSNEGIKDGYPPYKSLFYHY